MVLTAAHETQTREKLRLIVERGLIGGSTLGDDEAERLRRSGLIASQLIGFALLRYVWKIEPIASMPDDEVVAAMAPNLQRYVDGDILAGSEAFNGILAMRSEMRISRSGTQPATMFGCLGSRSGSLRLAVPRVRCCRGAPRCRDRAAHSPDVPPVSDAARAAGFVDVRTVVPDAVIDLRYATTNNFTGTQLYPSDARCLVHQSMAPGLAPRQPPRCARRGTCWCSGTAIGRTTFRSRCSTWFPTRPGSPRPGQYAHSHESGRSVDVTFTTRSSRARPSGTRSDSAWPTWAPTSTTSLRGQPLSQPRASAPKLRPTGPGCATR